VTRNTVKTWLAVLEATFLLMRIPAWSPNVRRRAVRAPKLHLTDTGLACHLLGIRSAQQLRSHPLRGALFEPWVATEIRKAGANRGVNLGLAHYRESRGAEVDIVVTNGEGSTLVEVKSGATVADDWLDGLRALLARGWDAETTLNAVVVYGGEQARRRHEIRVQPWRELHELPWTPVK